MHVPPLTFIESMREHFFEEGELVRIVLKEGARYLPVMPYSADHGWAPPSKHVQDEDYREPEGISCGGHIYKYSMDTPRKVYLAPSWDEERMQPAIEQEVFFVFEDAILMAEMKPYLAGSTRLFNR